METIEEIIEVLLLLVDAGGVMRGIFCFIRMNADQDNAKSYQNKIINMVIFLIIANSLYALVEVIKQYY